MAVLVRVSASGTMNTLPFAQRNSCRPRYTIKLSWKMSRPIGVLLAARLNIKNYCDHGSSKRLYPQLAAHFLAKHSIFQLLYR